MNLSISLTSTKLKEPLSAVSAGQVGLKSNEITEPLLFNLQFKTKLALGVLLWLSLQTLRWISGSKRSKRLLHITYPGRNRTARVSGGFNHVSALELRWWMYACWNIRLLANLSGVNDFSPRKVGLLPLFTVKPRRVSVEKSSTHFWKIQKLPDRQICLILVPVINAIKLRISF